jgi:hypothetical protein
MPVVVPLLDSDLAALLETVRQQLAVGCPGTESDELCVAILTPGRSLAYMSAGCRKLPARQADRVRRLAPFNRTADISVVSYTGADVFRTAGNALSSYLEASQCIPFLGYLLAFARAGHRVVVFEGHPSAFEAVVRNTDMLLIDSGMMPFLQPDWAAVAFSVMRPESRFVHRREGYQPRRWQRVAFRPAGAIRSPTARRAVPTAC